jgi:hypothetical protein
MAFGRGKEVAKTEAVPVAKPSALVASAARIKNLQGRAWQSWRFGDDSWQPEAWRLYDVIGELRFVANWIGSSCSRVRIYVAEVDENGRVQKEVEAKGKTKKIAALADSLFGSPAAKAEAIRLLGINLTIAGDAYVIGKDGADEDSDDWFVLSGSEIKRYSATGKITMTSYDDSVPEDLDPERDMIIRVWTPHPRRTLWADSPTRGALPMLWEIERLTRFVFAQIDSRLVSAGLLPIPKETSFPDEDVDVPGAEGLTALLMRTASSSLRGEGTAAGVVPTIVEMPMEALGKIQVVPFSSELSERALDLRAEALRRFALAMDIDPSILSGAGEANHWGAWQIMEGQIKIHIEPLMNRICDAITSAILVPSLKSMGEDPDRYIYWYDTAPLTVRPERLKETREMYDAGLVSKATVLLAGDYKISDAPDDKEDTLRFTRELMLRDPNLFQIPALRKIAGYTDEILPPDTVVTPQAGPGAPGAGPPPPPAPPTGISNTAGGPMPLDTVAQNAPGGPPPAPAGTPAAVTAAAAVYPLNVFVIANATVLRALELAGKRLAGNTRRFEYTCPAHEIHTQKRVGTVEKARSALAGAWDHLGLLVEQVDPTLDAAALRASLDTYCMTLLVRGKPHQVDLLKMYLERSGFLNVPA